eukprot:TRINITY_DN7294_c0_g2_i3.p1 TRINITY_DN7294_c0_g2~~TRINITY_DN7294_c0_g2_i3.p1  ORF type:complete len:188 (-),score=20.64 TRINITY_DN7294_c0_g2_i3:158-721(-)
MEFLSSCGTNPLKRKLSGQRRQRKKKRPIWLKMTSSTLPQETGEEEMDADAKFDERENKWKKKWRLNSQCHYIKAWAASKQQNKPQNSVNQPPPKWDNSQKHQQIWTGVLLLFKNLNQICNEMTTNNAQTRCLRTHPILQLPQPGDLQLCDYKNSTLEMQLFYIDAHSLWMPDSLWIPANQQEFLHA